MSKFSGATIPLVITPTSNVQPMSERALISNRSGVVGVYQAEHVTTVSNSVGMQNVQMIKPSVAMKSNFASASAKSATGRNLRVGNSASKS